MYAGVHFLTTAYEVHRYHEVVLKVNKTHDGEQVDENDAENSRQDYGATIPRNWADNIHQCFFLIGHVKQLGNNNTTLFSFHSLNPFFHGLPRQP